MKLRVLSACLLSATIISSFAAPGFAQTQSNTAATNTAAASQAQQMSPAQIAAIKKLNVVSDEGYAAVRGIALARLAIFQGEPDRAKTILTDVKKNLDQAQASTADLATKLKQADGPQDEIAAIQSGQVPIDFAVGVDDDYTVTPENAKHIDNANQHLGNGNTQKAVEELKLASANVFVTETDAKLPDLEKAVDDALAQIANQKYYEANLALMKAGDAITVRSLTENQNSPNTSSTTTQPSAAPAVKPN
ncbi:YfdX family protein [Phyllobacterium phragmitis]|uniref:YfdX family protein n=2 Tax=Hyphomicrobiales TaxID=356 RepID=A0ABQ0H687_9HYPH